MEMLMNFTALVVEDDTLQREILADLLKDQGLEVIECTTAEAAELVVASTGAELKALVTDISLAGEMSGTELAHSQSVGFPTSMWLWCRAVRLPTFPKMRRFC
jgi:CheY-like chemotaxis protein